MAVDTTGSASAILVVTGVIESLFTIVTLFRLAYRLRIRRLWWEDAWAAAAMVSAIAYISADLIPSVGEVAQNSNVGYIARRTSSYTFTTTVWFVRMSLLYSILRVTSPSSRLRNFMRAVGALFIAVCALLIALKTWWCDSSHSLPEPHECSVPRCIAILEVIVDFVGDAILVILSLGLLWKIKLPRRQRRMIIWSFSSNIVISMSSLLHAIAQIIDNGNLKMISTNIEFILCLIICNLLVVVTYVYRVFKFARSSESESSSSSDDDFTTPVTRRTTRSLTTVDLDLDTVTTTTTPVTSDQTV